MDLSIEKGATKPKMVKVVNSFFLFKIFFKFNYIIILELFFF